MERMGIIGLLGMYIDLHVFFIYFYFIRSVMLQYAVIMWVYCCVKELSLVMLKSLCFIESQSQVQFSSGCCMFYIMNQIWLNRLIG